MNVGILGTGSVGRTFGEKLAELGHDVVIGTRDPATTLARTAVDWTGVSFGGWHAQHPQIKVVTFAEAAAFGEILFNCTSGAASLDALKLAGEGNLDGKILIDVANPLDYSRGMPPSLTVCNTDSLGEQIQRAFPGLKVVKTLNTMNAAVMINPELVPGDHVVFVNGDDADAKATVTDILKRWFGWRTVIDLGDIKSARAVEMILPLWVQLMGVVGTAAFNFNIAR